MVLLSAHRRGIVTETLREKLELEKRALQVVERLLEDSVADDVLVDCVSTVQLLINVSSFCENTLSGQVSIMLCCSSVCALLSMKQVCCVFKMITNH